MFVNLDADATPLAELVGDLPRGSSATGSARSSRSDRPADGPAGELEGRRRELHRGLPHPDRPSRADADARLQALRRRGARALGVVRGADAREAEQQPPRAPVRAARRADARAAARRTAASGATRSSTRTRRSTCTPTRSTPGRCCPTASARTTRRVRLLPAARQRPAHARRAVDQPAPQHARPERGHRPRRQRPAGPADARLRCRSAVAARGRGRLVRRPHPRGPGPGAAP